MPRKSKKEPPPKFKNVQYNVANTTNKKDKDKKLKKVIQATTTESDTDDNQVEKVLSENLAKLPTITSEEFSIFKSVQEGDLVSLKSKVSKHININKTDKFGFSALHHAVLKQHEEVVDFLLNQPGILTYDTVFYAIQEQDIETTNKLLNHEDINKLGLTRQPLTSTKISTILPIRVSGDAASEQGNNSPLISSSVQASINSPSSSVIASSTIPGGTPGNSSPLTTKSSTKVTSRQSLKDLEDFDSEFPFYFTYLLKSAQMGDENFMELFWTRGERLESDEHHHNLGCNCNICLGSNKLITSLYERLHLFDAITNPNYICFLSKKQKLQFDPINYALHKIIKCQKLRDKNPIFKHKYDEYVERLEAFIKDFLSLCKTDEESEIFMSMPLDQSVNQFVKKKYKRLETLVGLNLANIISHPHAQYVVYKQWTASQWPAWQTYSWSLKLGHLVSRMFLFPFISMYLWVGNKGISPTKLSSPLSRCLNWVGSYMVFLAVLFFQAYLPQRCNNLKNKAPYTTPDGICKERGAPHTGLEWILFFYVIGFFISMLKKNAIPWIWNSYWTIYELIQQLILVSVFICWGVAWLNNHPDESRASWGQFYPEIVGESLLSIGIIFSFIRVFRIIQLNRIVGPLQIGLGRIIKRLFPGITLYFVFIVAFATGINAIYMPYNELDGFDQSGNAAQQTTPLGNVLASLEELFWAIYGMSAKDKALIIRFKTVNSGTTRHHWINENVGKVMFASYHIIAILMMFNLLVAFFTKDYDGVIENADLEWKFIRTQIYMTYEKETILPPPLNILPTLRGVFGFFEYLGLLCFGDRENQDSPSRNASYSFRQCCFIEEPRNFENQRDKRKNYRRLILELTNRYHRLVDENDRESTAVNDDVLKIGEDLAELKNQVKSRLEENEDSQKVETRASSLGTVSNEELAIIQGPEKTRNKVDQSNSRTVDIQSGSNGKKNIVVSNNASISQTDPSNQTISQENKSNVKTPIKAPTVPMVVPSPSTPMLKTPSKPPNTLNSQPIKATPSPSVRKNLNEDFSNLQSRVPVAPLSPDVKITKIVKNVTQPESKTETNSMFKSVQNSTQNESIVNKTSIIQTPPKTPNSNAPSDKVVQSSSQPLQTRGASNASKPSNIVATPSTPKPLNSGATPSPSTTKPLNSGATPSPSTPKPLNSGATPSPSTTKPLNSGATPSTPKPLNSGATPSPSTPKPLNSGATPSPSTPKPLNSGATPSPSTTKPLNSGATPSPKPEGIPNPQSVVKPKPPMSSLPALPPTPPRPIMTISDESLVQTCSIKPKIPDVKK